MYPRDVLTTSAKRVKVTQGFSASVPSSGGLTPPVPFHEHQQRSSQLGPQYACGKQLHFPAFNSHLTAEDCDENSLAAAALHHAALGFPRTNVFPDLRSLHYRHARCFHGEGTSMAAMQDAAREDIDEVSASAGSPHVGQQAHYFSQRNGGWILATIVEVSGQDIRLDVKSSWINVACVRLLPPPATSTYQPLEVHNPRGFPSYPALALRWYDPTDTGTRVVQPYDHSTGRAAHAFHEKVRCAVTTS